MSDELETPAGNVPGRPFPKSYTAANGVTYTDRDIPLQVLIDVATNEKEKARDRADAANKLLDRGTSRAVRRRRPDRRKLPAFVRCAWPVLKAARLRAVLEVR